MSKETCGLYIITHKPVKNIYPKGRKIMMVGAVNKQVPEGYYSDYAKDKENISDKNANFCELTGLYYMVKNDASDILSLEHYRRLFIKNRLYIFKYPFLSEKYIRKMLTKFDMIIPKQQRLETSVMEQYANNHYASDLEMVGEIIKKDYPDYYEAYSKVCAGNITYFCNMFIAKREIVVDYADWLFNILFKLEKMIDISERDTYQKRVFGFLSERMFTIYLLKHTELKLCEKPVVQTDVSPFKHQGLGILKRLKLVKM